MEFYIGQIIMGGWNFAPRGTAMCNGQLISIAQNTALFSLLGTNFGGDGRTTFGVPDLRGRVPMGWGDGAGLTPRRIGDKSGVENVTLNITEIPSHTHSLVNTGGSRATLEAGSGKTSATANGGYLAGTNTFLAAGGGGNIGGLSVDLGTMSISNTGGNQAHTNMQPYQAITFVIVLEGIFPSRS